MTRTTFKKGTFHTVDNSIYSDGKPKENQGYLNDYFGIHKRKTGWDIVHLASGLGVGVYMTLTLKQSKDIANEILGFLPSETWLKADPFENLEQKQKDELYTKIKKLTKPQY